MTLWTTMQEWWTKFAADSLKEPAPATPDTFTNHSTRVLFVLRSEGPLNIDDLAARTGLTRDQLNPVLSQLQMTDRIGVGWDDSTFAGGQIYHVRGKTS